jgi:hypothetical protein
LNRNGKIDRRALPALHSAPPTEQEAVTNDVEAGVMQCWREVIDGGPIGPTDRFFDVGGNSLLLFSLQRSLASRFGVDLTAPELFKTPTPRSQAIAIERMRQTTASGAQPRAVRCGDFTAAPATTRALAIVGAACRLPMARNPEEFWELQINGRDCITEAPDERQLSWGHRQGQAAPSRRRGGFLRDVDLFDQGIQRKRFSVKPGLTCLWQVSGRSNLPFSKWLELDLYYIEHWSLAFDLRIIALTFVRVFRDASAY